MEVAKDTIAAIATPPGNGGVAIIRISGKLVPQIADTLLGTTVKPRYAHYTSFKDAQNNIIDNGLLLYFPAPHSFTGEHVLELHGHGGRVVADMLLRHILTSGVRLAKPGEFSERAYLNNKIDLAQAEAIADLINSSTEQSVRSAQRSLQGEFSEKINLLLQELTELRIYVEASIDFVDEEIDFLSDGIIANKLKVLGDRLIQINQTAQQGRLLRDGMTVVLAGKPNAGKSSLMNALAGSDVAIVTELAGTTRDVLRESIQIDGMPLHVIDTAGIRESENPVEQEGVRRAYNEISQADLILLLVDGRQPQVDDSLILSLPSDIPRCIVFNKIDLTGKKPQIQKTESGYACYLSIKTGSGMDYLKNHLKSIMGYQEQTESVFIARRRHIEALTATQQHVENAVQQLTNYQAGELVAEELKLAQNHLSEITGEFSNDDLLGKIFSSFCIGK